MPGVSIEHQVPLLSVPRTTAATQLRIWVERREGRLIWEQAGTLPSIERICHALDNTHALNYGLLITPQFFAIISTLNPVTFTRLEERYQEAARTGLCFWWEGCVLVRYEQPETFFELLRALPLPHLPHTPLVRKPSSSRGDQ